MSCDDVHTMIHPYLDGELDLVRNIDIEHHLEACPDCARMLAQYQALRSAMTHGSLYFHPPKSLERRIHAAIQKTENRSRLSFPRTWRPFALAASVAVAMFVLWKVVTLVSPISSHDGLANEILQSHIRSLMVDHLTDVPSSDQHTVKPWFNGKVGFSPVVKDLSAQGFLLLGGRLDYVDSKTVAVLVYQRRQHIINLFIWPTTDNADLESAGDTRQGYHFSAWHAAGMTYCAVSDLNGSELRVFIELVRSPQ